MSSSSPLLTSLPDPASDPNGKQLRHLSKILEQSLNNSDAAVRASTLDWLRENLPNTTKDLRWDYIRLKTTGAVVAAVSDNSPDVRAKAISILPSYVTDSELIGDLIGVINDDADSGVREVAIRILPQVNKIHVPLTITALTTAANDQDVNVRKVAIEALRKTDREAASTAVPVLSQALQDPDKGVCCEAIATLSWLGSLAISVLLPLLKAAVYEEEQVCSAAILAILKIDPNLSITLSYLHKIDGVQTREAVARKLRRIGPEALPLLTALQNKWVTEEVSKAQPFHIDGPELPDTFWYKGEPHHLEPKVCEFLDCVWGKCPVAIAEVAGRVWNGKNQPSALKSLISKLRRVLEEANVPYVYGKRKSFIVQKSYP
jgi:HEAT repeats